VLRLLLVNWGWDPFFYRTEGAATGTHVSQDEKSGGTLGEALSDIWAMSIFTDSVEA